MSRLFRHRTPSRITLDFIRDAEAYERQPGDVKSLGGRLEKPADELARLSIREAPARGIFELQWSDDDFFNA